MRTVTMPRRPHPHPIKVMELSLSVSLFVTAGWFKHEYLCHTASET